MTSDQGDEQAIDGLVGLWFHSWEEAPEDADGARTIVGGRAVVWQGQVVGRDGQDFLVQCYSWWDGMKNGGEQLIGRSQMRDWTFYRSSGAMQIALGCREFLKDGRCRRPATHRTNIGGYVCWRCAKFYGGGVEVDSDGEPVRQRPTRRGPKQLRSEIGNELRHEIQALKGET